MWTDGHGGREAMFDDPGTPFFNVNTPEDLARAHAMLEGDK
jgi:molybdopterin-guanine dinucleotide biosynthesis protein A